MAKKVNMKAGDVIIGVLALAVIAFLVISYVPMNVSGSDLTNPSLCPDSKGIITVSAVNALEKGTAVASPTLTAVLDNGVQKTITSGTSTLAIGQKFDLLVSKADYIDLKISDLEMNCGGLEISAELYYATSDNPSLKIKNDDGDYMTDAIAGGATNQTDLSAGETVNFDVEFQGTALESTGDLIYIVEFPASSGVNISSVEMAGATKLASVPSVHASNNAASEIVAFEIPALVGSAKKTYTLSVSLESAKDLAGGVYTDWYAKQYFTDDDGSIQYGIQDASGDAQYENTGDFDFLIN